MPNGHDRNWVRFCAAVDGFRARHGHWPERVAMEAAYLEDLERMFSAESLAMIKAKIELHVQDDAHMLAQDSKGNDYDYAIEGFPDDGEARAADWFGVEPIDEDK